MAAKSVEGTLTGTTPDLPISTVIRDELFTVRKTRASVFAEPGHPLVHGAVILLCIAINVLYFIFRRDYIALFIAASFYLNMFYFISLLIPQNLRRTGLPAETSGSSESGSPESG